MDIEESSVDFAASGNVPVSVKVQAVGVEWECRVPESYGWITASKTDDRTLTISVTDNDTRTDRLGKVRVIDSEGEVSVREITVTQAKGEAGEECSIAVDPASLSFVAEEAEPQQVKVTVTGEGLSWGTEVERGSEWLHVDRRDDTLVVSVDDNPSQEQRVATLTIVPAESSVAGKAVRVMQDGRVFPPSISVDPSELRFGYMKEFGRTVNVEAVNTGWNAKTSTTPDNKGQQVEWLEMQVFNTAGNSSVLVTALTNTTLEQRTGYVVITSDKSEAGDIYIPVVQDAGREFMTTLTNNVEVTDMTGAGSVLEFIPTQEWSDATTAIWYMSVWGEGLDFVTVDWPWSQKYYGSGSRFYLTIRSEAIKFNDDNIYYLPEGEYNVAPNDPNNKTPFTIVAGEASQNIITPRGAWYYALESDEYVQRAPLAGGGMKVERSGDEYTLTFDFVDDAGFRITGDCVAHMKVKVISSPTSKPER